MSVFIALSVFASLMIVMGPVLAWIALVRVSKTERRLALLQRTLSEYEKKIEALRKAGARNETPLREPASRTAEHISLAVQTDPYTGSTSAKINVSAAAFAQTPQSKSAPERAPVPPLLTRFYNHVVGNLRQNWLVWLAATSLSLGGVFIVQYGIENGLLSPFTRIIFGVIFGLCLLVSAEYFYQQTAGLASWFEVPVALAGAGIATLYAVVMGAYWLYELIGPLAAFAGFAGVSWLAIGLGLRFGPVVATVGVLGAYFTPVFVESSAPSAIMYPYVLLVLLAALTIERVQKWIWLSALAVVSSFWWVWILHGLLPQMHILPYACASILILTAAQIGLGVKPTTRQSTLFTDPDFWIVSKNYPVLLIYAAAGLAVAMMVLESLPPMSSLAVHNGVGLVALTGLAIYALPQAQRLDLLAPVFVAAFVLIMTFQTAGNFDGQNFWAFMALTAVLALIGVHGSFWRAARSTRPHCWYTAAALTPLIAVSALWQWMQISPLLVQYWVLLCFGAIAVLAVMGSRFRAMTPSFQRGVELAATSSYLVLGAIVYLSLKEVSLTLAFAALAVAIPEISKKINVVQASKLFLLFLSIYLGRALIDPGVSGALDAATSSVHLLFMGSLVLLSLGWYRANTSQSSSQAVSFETSFWAVLSVYVMVLLGRWMTGQQGLLSNHLAIAFYALPVFILSVVQIQRLKVVTSFRMFRRCVALAYIGVASVLALALVFVVNPLYGGKVQGPYLLDSLALAYLVPAGFVLLLIHCGRPLISHATLAARLQLAAYGGAAVLLALYVGLEIRRFWHGDVLTQSGILLPELYSYTIALLVASAVAIMTAVLRKHLRLAQTGLVLIAITCGKVFLMDMSGLDGLARASSFIGLGLTLCAIAWIHQHYLKPIIATSPAEQS
ncbi:DUF2339 domain-containing protein [Flexibacterium corallicola]|uniref:DUF2339 domain-containing protein n=1 Tax=Flexibacterium corallicola TaxID=3037259 RepID=UPI00286F2CED|nr:DUF2339 domain-containing protein [Pseudovibrio sp. M1P-2-3]